MPSKLPLFWVISHAARRRNKEFMYTKLVLLDVELLQKQIRKKITYKRFILSAFEDIKSIKTA